MDYHPSSSYSTQFTNPAFGDTTYTKVFVGGLAWETQSETLRQHFEKFGEILEAVVIADKNTGRSKGYGFVTFREPEAARRACADPAPVIDGRRANCNLASLGRARPPPPFGHQRSPVLYVGSSGSTQPPRGAYMGNFGYQQPLYYSYQQGYAYPAYGYSTYGPEYVYPQGTYNPYMGQQHLQSFGMQGPVNATIYPYAQLGQSISNGRGYTALPGYTMPSYQIAQLGGSSADGITTSHMSTIQASYHPGIVSAFPTRPQMIIPGATPTFMQSSTSDRTSG